MFSYDELVMKYGPSTAYHCLTEIEKATRIPLWTVDGVDPETRLANAIYAQDIAHKQMGFNDNHCHA